MRPDRYTKVVLTVIAAALVAIAASLHAPKVEADATQRVVLVGVQGMHGVPVQVVAGQGGERAVLVAESESDRD